MTTIQQPVALKLAEVIDAFDQVNESLPLEMLPILSTELRRLHEVNAELLRLVKLVHGSFSGGRVMTFSWEDVEDFENAINKAEGETE